MTIKFYLDQECTKPIDVINWKNKVLVLTNGEKVTFENAYEIGEIAITEFYIRNEGNTKYGVTNVKLPDDRIKYKLDSSWLHPNIPVKITLSFPVKDEVMFKGNDVIIEGYYVYEKIKEKK